VFTFNFDVPDDAVWMWLGPNAYSGWTRANADVFVGAAYYGATAQSFSTTLVEGEYVPLRILFAQAQGGMSFYFSITAPDGTVVLDSNTQDSPYLVQYSCDGVTGPAFPAFGAET
jgi:hypothetical protein